jgi:nitroimidazol reductase NimA-like FMN-containing flavoprotein (pyridoxamine 5'-phosphate oxidase superfamily)
MTDHDPVTTLSDEESWEMLRETEFGRLAFHLVDEVHIVPMNYAVDDLGRLVFRTAEGSKLLGLTINADVAFEIDDFGEELARSVVVHGRARILEGREADATDALPLRPWVDTAKFNVVAVEPDEVTGRQFVLNRPWTHMIPHHEI